MSETSLSLDITDEAHPVHDYAKERSFRLRDFSGHLDLSVQDFMIERLGLKRCRNPDSRLIAARLLQIGNSELVVLRLVKRPNNQAGYYLELGWLGPRPDRQLIDSCRRELERAYLDLRSRSL